MVLLYFPFRANRADFEYIDALSEIATGGNKSKALRKIISDHRAKVGLGDRK